MRIGRGQSRGRWIVLLHPRWIRPAAAFLYGWCLFLGDLPAQPIAALFLGPATPVKTQPLPWGKGKKEKN